MLAGTLLELALTSFEQHSKNQESTFAVSFLLCFSVVRSTAVLFRRSPGHQQKVSRSKDHHDNEKADDDDDEVNNYNKIEHRLSFLHGVRAALVAWIVTAHSIALLPASIAMPVAMLARHPHDMIALAAKNGLLSTFFNNGTLAVEAFFLIR